MSKTISPLERIYEAVDYRLPGALRNVLKFELFLVLDEFFRKSLVWTDEVDFDTKLNRREYDIVPSMGMIIHLNSIQNGDNVPYNGAVLLDSRTLQLRNEPNGVERLTANVSLTVTDPTTRDGDPYVPIEHYEANRNVLIDGLLGRMMIQPGKPYTNLALGQMHYTRFVSGCSRGRYD